MFYAASGEMIDRNDGAWTTLPDRYAIQLLFIRCRFESIRVEPMDSFVRFMVWFWLWDMARNCKVMVIRVYIISMNMRTNTTIV